MRLALNMPLLDRSGAALDAAGITRRAQLMEREGFDGIWLGDSFSPGMTRPDPLMWLLVAAAATTTILDDDEIQSSAITTIDIFARFIRPVNAKKIERLRAEARVIRAGGRLVWAEADVLADNNLVGKFASTGIRVAFDPSAYIAERGASDE